MEQAIPTITQLREDPELGRRLMQELHRIPVLPVKEEEEEMVSDVDISCFLEMKPFSFTSPAMLDKLFPPFHQDGARFVMTSPISPDSHSSPPTRAVKVKYDDGTETDDMVVRYTWLHACLDCQRSGAVATCDHFPNEVYVKRKADLLSVVDDAKK